MHFLGHLPESDARWQRYRQLELVPDTVSNPNQIQTRYTLGLGWVWRKLITLLIAELAAENRLEEYLERCWTLDHSREDEELPNSLQKLWALMD